MRKQNCLWEIFCFAVATLLVLSGSASADTCRPLPLAYTEVSVGSAVGRDYATLAAAEDATDTDCVAGSKGWVITMYPDSASYDQTVVISGATSNVNYRRVFRAAPGYERQVVIDSTSVQDTIGGTIYVSAEDYVGLYDLTVKFHVNDDVVCKALMVAASNTWVVGCVIGPLLNTNAAGGIGLQLYGSSRSISVTNTVFQGALGTDNLYGVVCASGSAITFNNNVIYKWSTAWYGVGATSGTATNCIFDDNTTEVWTNGPTFASCIRNADGFNAFVDAAAGNFKITSSATTAINQGADMSATYTDDMFGYTRPTGAAFDIGVHEYQPPAGGTGWVWFVN